MAKIRGIKPEFWSDDELAECSPLARLLFIGLWNFADDNGVFQWRTKKIKVQILPFDKADENKLLSELIKSQHIKKFKHEGKEYGIVKNLAVHQKIDQRYFKEFIVGFSKLKSKLLQENTPSTPRVPATVYEGVGDGVYDGDGVGIGDKSPATQEFGNEEINSVYKFIKEKTGLPAVSGQQARRSAYNLLRAFKKNYPDSDAVELYKKIITLAIDLNDKWHSTKANDPKHIFYNWQEILNLSKKKTTSIPDFSK